MTPPGSTWRSSTRHACHFRWCVTRLCWYR
jgi:hypothetical protein